MCAFVFVAHPVTRLAAANRTATTGTRDPRVSVVVATFTEDRFANLASLVHAVAAQTRPADELIIVVDHNEALRVRASEGFPYVVVVPNAYDRGLSGARNSGADVATGDVLAFLDDDVEPSQHWLEHLTRPYADDDVLGVGGDINPRWAGRRPVWFPEEFDWVVGCTYTGLTGTTKAVRNLIGANMSMRRDVLVRAGGFRSDFSKVGTKSLPDETELCLRASRLHPGRVWLHVATAHVSHHVPTSRASFRYFARRCWNEGVGKARLSRAEGRATALKSERAYLLNTVAAGVARGVVHTVRRRDPGGIARSAALLFGVLATVGAYVLERGRLLAAQR